MLQTVIGDVRFAALANVAARGAFGKGGEPLPGARSLCHAQVMRRAGAAHLRAFAAEL